MLQVPADRRKNINEENQRKRHKWMENVLADAWTRLLETLLDIEKTLVFCDHTTTCLSIRYPYDGDVPPKNVFYKHQSLLITVLFLEWCGIRRELVWMQTIGNFMIMYNLLEI